MRDDRDNRQLLDRDLPDHVRALIERTTKYKAAQAERLAKDCPGIAIGSRQGALFSRGQGRDRLPEHAWTGFKRLGDSPVAKPPSPRTKRRAEARAKALDEDLAKEKAKIDGTGKSYRRRFRGGSRFIEPPSNEVDVFHRTLIWNDAEALERKSHARRGKRRRNGQLGWVALELLRTILFRLNKTDDGKVYPSYETLAELTRYCQRAIYYAMKKLEQFGFVTIHRRCKWQETRYGRRCVQDSNAYEYHRPKTGIGKLAMAVFVPKSSDCMGIREEQLPSTNEKRFVDDQNSDVGARFWLVEPIPLGDGGYI
jgi:hypothetical protein